MGIFDWLKRKKTDETMPLTEDPSKEFSQLEAQKESVIEEHAAEPIPLQTQVVQEQVTAEKPIEQEQPIIQTEKVEIAEENTTEPLQLEEQTEQPSVVEETSDVSELQSVTEVVTEPKMSLFDKLKGEKKDVESEVSTMNTANEEDMSEESVEEDIPEKKGKSFGFFSKLVSGLTKTRNSIASSLNSVFSANHIDDDFYEELEETLIMADMGVETTMNILDELREAVKKQHIKEPADCKDLLIDIIKNQMSLEPNAYDFENQKSVVMIIGVNGVGKTTSIGKLAAQFRKNKKKVIMAAADTFRAAAIEQLTEWAHRSQVDIIAQKEGADPSAVVYDALQAAKARNTDILLIDTAGRLHNKKNLMDELSKMNRIIDREYPDAYKETLIVLDGTTGQNALEQAKQFKQVADIDGIILTKLDGTAKGGIAIAIHSELGVPVKYIGVGEGIDDLQKFDPEDYVNAIFTTEDVES